MRRAVLLTLLIAFSLVLVGTRFYPKVERLHVVGAVHYSEAEVLRLADVQVGDPLLWITTRQLRGLKDNPWILRARVVRRWPDLFYVEVTERTPVLTEGATSYALDGTVLPDVTAAERARTVTLKGWGPDRTEEALLILRLVAPYEPQMLSYTPSGFTVHFAESSLFTPGAAPLQAHWAAFVGQQADSVAVYPWGVSVQ